jgi:hypothetical protein
MKKLTLILSGLLVVQLVVTGAIFWHRHQQQQQQVARILFNFKPLQAAQIVIADAKGQVKLTRQGKQWILPDLDHLPAEQSRIQDLLTRLTSLKAAWPVADSTPAQKRFKVAPSDFHRHLTIKDAKGQILANLYLGTAPVFHQRHLRLAQHDAIYQVRLPAYPLPVAAKGWLNTHLIAARQPTSITGNDFRLKREKALWQWQGKLNQQKQSLDQTKATELSQALAGLSVSKIATQPIQGDPQFKLSVTQKAKNLIFRFWHQNKIYQIARSDYPQRFAVSRAQYQQLTKFSAATLLQNVKAKKAPVAPQSGSRTLSQAKTGHKTPS